MKRPPRGFRFFAAALAAAGLSAYVLHHLVGLGSPVLVEDWLYNALMAGAALGCLTRGVTVARERAAWLVLGLGLAAWSAGDLYWTFVLADDPELPVITLSDALYLAFYPAAYVALVLLVRARVRRLSVAVWLDGAVGALACGALAAAVVLGPVLDGSGGDKLAVAVNLAYPVGDVLLLALSVGALGLVGWKVVRPLGAVAAGFAAAAAADGWFLYRAATQDVVGPSVLDSLWPAGLLLLAWAAWQSTPAVRSNPGGLAQLVAPSVFALVAVSVLL